MNDLISRQAAIDALDGVIHMDEEQQTEQMSIFDFGA